MLPVKSTEEPGSWNSPKPAASGTLEGLALVGVEKVVLFWFLSSEASGTQRGGEWRKMGCSSPPSGFS